MLSLAASLTQKWKQTATFTSRLKMPPGTTSERLAPRFRLGQFYTVRYEAVNAMLLNEFLKEHRKVEEQKAGLAEMKSVVSKQEGLIAEQQKQIEALTATVQKVSDRVALSNLAPQLVANP